MRKTFSILLLLLLVTLPRLASAHAVLLDAMPADGSRVDAPPSMVMLHFNEPVVPIEVRLVDANGHTIAGPGLRMWTRTRPAPLACRKSPASKKQLTSRRRHKHPASAFHF